MKTKKEVWKKVVTGDGIDWKRYSVSSYGRVRNDKNGRIRKSIINIRNGYLQVNLCKNGKVKTYNIHRLVALAFIPNDDPLHKTQVNHKNENKTNNTVENLEWCTPEYNANYGTRNKRIMKQIIAINKSGEIIGYGFGIITSC
jgi:predicted transcriptional regulator YheO